MATRLPRVVINHGGPVPYIARAWAGLLWAGSDAMVSHDTAGFLVGLLDREPAQVHVAIPEARRLVAPAGVLLHRTSRPDLDPRRRPPQTTVERTTLDLVNGAKTLDRAVAVVAKPLQMRLTTEARLLAALGRTPSLRWRRDVAHLLGPQLDGVRSALEFRYARDVERAHRLPSGRRQLPGVHPHGPRTLRDVTYAGFGVVVELDGRLGHLEGHEFRDMARDNRTSELGEITLRYGWVDVRTRPCAVALQVSRVLRLRGWTGSPTPCGSHCELRTTR
jgi:hypothetical protein